MHIYFCVIKYYFTIFCKFGLHGKYLLIDILILFNYEELFSINYFFYNWWRLKFFYTPVFDEKLELLSSSSKKSISSRTWYRHGYNECLAIFNCIGADLFLWR